MSNGRLTPKAFKIEEINMDPLACLQRLTAAIAKGDYSDAVAALNDYYRWRLGDGFEPLYQGIKGDEYVDQTANRLSDILADTEEEEETKPIESGSKCAHCDEPFGPDNPGTETGRCGVCGSKVLPLGDQSGRAPL